MAKIMLYAGNLLVACEDQYPLWQIDDFYFKKSQLSQPFISERWGLHQPLPATHTSTSTSKTKTLQAINLESHLTGASETPDRALWPSPWTAFNTQEGISPFALLLTSRASPEIGKAFSFPPAKLKPKTAVAFSFHFHPPHFTCETWAVIMKDRAVKLAFDTLWGRSYYRKHINPSRPALRFLSDSNFLVFIWIRIA